MFSPIEWTLEALRSGIARSERLRRSTPIEPSRSCPQSIVSLPCPSFSHEWSPMLRRLPPLNALKAFEAAARHESFTRAAEELCVTQGAVSHQVKALEVELGKRFCDRAYCAEELVAENRIRVSICRAWRHSG